MMKDMNTSSTSPIEGNSVNTSYNEHARHIFCSFHRTDEVVEFIITVLISSGGIVVTILAIAFSIINKAIDPALRGILISYSIANFFGTLMLTFDTITTICLLITRFENLGIVITISIFLSLFHILFLLLCEYQALTSVARRTISTFSGLIIVSWIISSCIGCTLILTTHIIGRCSFIGFFIITIIMICMSFLWIIKKSRIIHNTRTLYETKYLDLQNYRSKVVKRYWKLKYFAIIFVSYVATSAPWILKQLHGGTFLVRSEHQHTVVVVDSAVLLVYSTNFYFPSAIIIYLWLKKVKVTKNVRRLYSFARKAKKSIAMRENNDNRMRLRATATRFQKKKDEMLQEDQWTYIQNREAMTYISAL